MENVQIDLVLLACGSAPWAGNVWATTTAANTCFTMDFPPLGNFPEPFQFHWIHRSIPVEVAAERLPSWAHGLVWGGMLVLLGLNQGSDNAFIYFQF